MTPKRLFFFPLQPNGRLFISETKIQIYGRVFNSPNWRQRMAKFRCEVRGMMSLCRVRRATLFSNFHWTSFQANLQ